MANPKGPCTQVAYTVAPKYLYRDYFKAKVCTIWAHGPLGKALELGLKRGAEALGLGFRAYRV